MPNHVKNVLKFKNLKSKDDINFILNMIASPGVCLPTDPIEVVEWNIDFNKIIKEPEEILDCPTEYIVTGSEHVEKLEDKPWFNWYQWHLDKWGTKWGAYDCYTKIGRTYITFVFSTAWSMPEPIYQRLAVLGYNMEIRYADEDLGHNCGILEYDTEQGWAGCDEDSYQIKDPYKFAYNLWNKY